MNFLNKRYSDIQRWLSAAFQTGTTDQVLARDTTLDLEVKWVNPSSLSGVTDADAIHDNVAAEISAITAKATPVAADTIMLEDSAASDAKKSAAIGAYWTVATDNFSTTGTLAAGTPTFTCASVGTFTHSSAGAFPVVQISAGTSGQAADGNARTVFVESDRNGGMTIGTAGDRSNFFMTATGKADDAVQIFYTASLDLLTVGTAYSGGETSLVGGLGSLGVRVDPSGNVGIKTPSPSADLDVAGDIVFSGSITGSGTGLTGVLNNIVEDTTPQLGGHLDVNGQVIGDGTRELLTFVEDASAVNHIEIENEATGSGPIVRATGDDMNVDLNLATKGAGIVLLNASVLLGASLPAAADGTLHVQSASAGAVTADTNADEGVFEGSGNTGISILGGNDSVMRIFLGSASDNSGARVVYNANTNTFHIGSGKSGAITQIRSDNGVVALTLDSSQDATFAGDVTIGSLTTPSSYLGMTAKASDTTNNTTTFQNATDVLFPMEASKSYSFKLIVHNVSPVSAGIKFQWSLPSGGTVAWGAVTTANPVLASGGLAFSTSILASQVIFDGVITNSTTAGDAQFQFAQSVSDAGPTTVLKFTRIEAWKLD